MRKRRDLSERVEVQNPEVKARVLAVLQSLSGEKSVSEICRETGLQRCSSTNSRDRSSGDGEAAEASSSGDGAATRSWSQDLEERNLRPARKFSDVAMPASAGSCSGSPALEKIRLMEGTAAEGGVADKDGSSTGDRAAHGE